MPRHQNWIPCEVLKQHPIIMRHRNQVGDEASFPADEYAELFEAGCVKPLTTDSEPLDKSSAQGRAQLDAMATAAEVEAQLEEEASEVALEDLQWPELYARAKAHANKDSIALPEDEKAAGSRKTEDLIAYCRLKEEG